jgi:hypothetical protein
MGSSGARPGAAGRDGLVPAGGNPAALHHGPGKGSNTGTKVENGLSFNDEGEFAEGDTVEVDLRAGDLTFTVAAA